MQKKIAILANSFWATNAVISGGDQRLIQIFKRIGKNFDLDIYTSSVGKKLFSKDLDFANYIISDHQCQGNILVSYFKRNKQALREIKKHSYDIIYSSSDFFPDVVPAFVYKKFHPQTRWIQCIFHLYPKWWKRPGSKIIALVGYLVQRYSFRKIKRSADRIVNINSDVKKFLESYGIERDRLNLVPCGVDLEKINSYKPSPKKYDGAFLARLAPSKGIFDLPLIWGRVVKKFPKARLAIIGGGSNEIKQKLKKLIAENGLSKNIDILGYLPEDKAFGILKSAKVFLFPSYEEGWGIAIAEAMACGIPVVAWYLPVYREVFPSSIKAITENDINQFAGTVLSILSDHNFVSSETANAKNLIQKYSWDVIAKKENIIISKVKLALLVDYFCIDKIGGIWNVEKEIIQRLWRTPNLEIFLVGYNLHQLKKKYPFLSHYNLIDIPLKKWPFYSDFRHFFIVPKVISKLHFNFAIELSQSIQFTGRNFHLSGFVYDLTPLLFPELHRSSKISYLRYGLVMGYALRRANLLFAISKNTKDDLVRTFKLDQKKIKVIPLGYEKKKTREIDIIKKYKINKNFFLAVGTLEPRKNYHFLIELFDNFADDPNYSNIDLVIIGKFGWKYEKILQAYNIARNRKRIKIINNADDDDLMAFYKQSIALVYPSLYEGFGLPVVEAMSFGKPVIISNTSSLKEFNIDKSFKLPPTDQKAFVTIMKKLVDKPKYAKIIGKKNLELSKQYSWRTSIEGLVNALLSR